jgi:hypothetical protein
MPPHNLYEFLNDPEARGYIASRYGDVLAKWMRENGADKPPEDPFDQFDLWNKAIRVEYKRWVREGWVIERSDCGHEPTGWITVGGDEFPSMDAAERHMEMVTVGDEARFRRLFEGPWEIYRIGATDEEEVEV